MTETKIEWTDAVWNPVRGCSRVSEGCRNCYAERIAARFSGRGQPYEGFAQVAEYHPQTGSPRTGLRGHWTGRVELIPEKLNEPLHWRKPRRVFVNSMSDLFHEELPDQAISDVFSVMESARRHTFQILTKRPKRMLAWVKKFDEWLRYAGSVSFVEKIPNVWLGVSVEDQATADARIPLLLQTPAAVRFVSYEPALAPVDFKEWFEDGIPTSEQLAGPRGAHYVRHGVPRLHWLICGGESGPGARPMDVAWARSVIAHCKIAGVPCFVKQLGAKPFTDHRTRPSGENWYWTSLLRDRKGGDPAEWPEDLRVREFPVARTPEPNRGKVRASEELFR